MSVQEGEAESTKTDLQTIEESIRSAYEEAEQELEGAQPKEPEEAPESPPEDQVEQQTQDDSEDQKPEDSAEASDTEQDKTDVAAVKGDDLRFLNEDERSGFDKLPDEGKALVAAFMQRRDLSLQQYVTRVRGQFQQQYNQALAPLQQLETVIGPHLEDIKRSGKTVAQTIEIALSWNKRLDEHPLIGIAELCRRHQVAPRAVYDYLETGSAEESQESGKFDPRIDELSGKIDALAQNFQSGQVNAEKAAFNDQMRAFEFSVNEETGERNYPYSEFVKGEMMGLIPQIAQQPGWETANQFQLFHEAYNRAVYANPQVRALIQNQQAARSGADNLKKKEASSSLKASSSGVAGSTPKTPPKTHRQSILAAVDELGIDLDQV